MRRMSGVDAEGEYEHDFWCDVEWKIIDRSWSGRLPDSDFDCEDEAYFAELRGWS